MAKSSTRPRLRRGRPAGGKTRQRSEASREAILVSTLDLLDEMGYAALTIEQVAERARTGKTTIYRGWGTKAGLVFDAVSRKRWEAPGLADSEEVMGDLKAFLEQLCRGLASAGTAVVLAALMVEAHADPVLRDQMERGLLGEINRSLETILRLGVERGQLRNNLDVPLTADCLLGVLWQRLLSGRGDVGATLARQVPTELGRGWGV